MLMSTDHGDAYTFADYQAMFEAAGFVRNEMIKASPFAVTINGQFASLTARHHYESIKH